jgi:hypothetical protein
MPIRPKAEKKTFTAEITEDTEERCSPRRRRDTEKR